MCMNKYSNLNQTVLMVASFEVNLGMVFFTSEAIITMCNIAQMYVLCEYTPTRDDPCMFKICMLKFL